MLFETTIGCQDGSTASTPQQFPGFETGIAVSTVMPSVGRFRPVLSGRSTNILNTPTFLRLLRQHLPFLAAYLPFNRLPTVRGFFPVSMLLATVPNTVSTFLLEVPHKSSIFMALSIINHPFSGTPTLGTPKKKHVVSSIAPG